MTFYAALVTPHLIHISILPMTQEIVTAVRQNALSPAFCEALCPVSTVVVSPLSPVVVTASDGTLSSDNTYPCY